MEDIQLIEAVAPLVFIISFLCAPPGMGGGTLFVPVLHIIGHLSPKGAAATSQALVASATLAKVLSSCYLHTRSTKPIILLRYAFIMLPAMVVGGLLGVYLYTWIPQIVQFVLYILTAMLASYIGFKKGMRLWNQETLERSTDRISNLTDVTTSTSCVAIDTVMMMHRPLQAPLIPRQSILFIVALCIIWLVVVVSRLLLGSAGTPSLIGIPYCESLYWALSVVVIAVLLAVPGIYIIVNKSPGVFNISIKLSAALLCIGFIAAMVGQGGGTLITPLLLHMELDPAQASATGSVVMLVTSSSLALSFGLGGFLPAASDMWIIVLPFFGALIGDLLLSKLMKWAGRLSLLALSLAVLATTGAMVIFVTGIVQVLSASQHQGGGTSPFTLGSIC